MKRTLALALAAATASSMVATAAIAAPSLSASPAAAATSAKPAKPEKPEKPAKPAKPPKPPKPTKPPVPDARTVPVQLLSFSDFHGHLSPEALTDKAGNVFGVFGGAAYLAGLVNQLSTEFVAQHKHALSYTVSSGDSIGGSTFASGLFHDEGTIEVLNAMDLTASAVGNHEFDEGVAELMRIVNGGNHPEDGQYLDQPYAGTSFPYLAANVVWKDSGETILPPYTIEKKNGIKVGFIGVVTDETPILVSPGGISQVTFLDETETLNKYAVELQAKGVQSIVALVHEGGYDGGAYSGAINEPDVNAGCDTLTGPIVDINAGASSAIDVLLTGHTHNGFACLLPDPAGNPRAVNGPGDWGRVLSETTFKVDRKTKDVIRASLAVENHLVLADGSIAPDAQVQKIVDKWIAKAAVLAGQVIGTTTEDITGDASGDRGVETPMGDLLADAILWGTQESGAQISFMNIGGVRGSFLVNDISNGEAAGEITYQEAYDVAPFGNLLVTLDLTGAQIEAVLNQQYNPSKEKQLALGVSEGFSYAWDDATHSVVPGSMTLDGVPVEAGQTYRVSTLSFLAEGGDGFTAFTGGTNLVGGPEDLANLVAYIKATSPLSAPEDRVSGL
ncbi:MAG: bifunctional metallophosphatase/5'-nucleotidase [Ornithinimicrobium sp.]|uniref:bifunctional metallophosphatase/5'-nucleotidase n=1 Tax=Ornithinimicrobium sp. TaxID=1977084 RepID=UPI0026DF5ADF|nr:bifunctional metallophosphatase/5'-nucleotidase [Ornithinimicrobium sp.]MDO5740434.1 bifunctional metallophosphatase/5'-nucleotidase [Ornithinimicrobium sp.]